MAFDPTARPPLRKALAALGNPEYRWQREALGVLEFATADGNPGGVLQVIDRLQKGVALLATLAERGHEPGSTCSAGGPAVTTRTRSARGVPARSRAPLDAQLQPAQPIPEGVAMTAILRRCRISWV